MGQLTMANGLIIKSMAKVPTFGKTAGDTTASGQTTTCRGMESTYTQMAFDTTVSTLMIRKRVTDCTTGLMVDNTKGGGARVSSMA